MKKQKCIKCDKKLFTYSQDKCWMCIKSIILDVLTNLSGEEREVMVLLSAVTANHYEQEW